ncbi:hypothetical protein ACFVXG_27635 [Kitasatospora sp. NPDC058162]|uniref:hypothetical protein n=1 Tax=Kitasatospora sp. NPDC058162 TaxID=3346362 RepID=UPI0036D9DAFF
MEPLAHQLDAPLARIDDAGHEPCPQQPEVARAHLRRFVRAGTSRRRRRRPMGDAHPPGAAAREPTRAGQWVTIP